ncbi:solute carrier family 22 member 18-like [Antedon mediterranea]|uniref:solute carrier family 22 member 18-like n=1 Tax=Antedon mediterranea TaxID=105859 RepID=UPI003AF43086
MKLRSHKMLSNQLNPSDSQARPNTEEEATTKTDTDDDNQATLPRLMDGDSSTDGPRLRKTRQWAYLDMDVIKVVHVNLFLYSTCFSIQTGVLPYLTRSLNLDTVQFGYLQTTFYLVQLIGGPLYGRFADVHGSRIAMLLAFSSAALMYGILGAATSAFGVFLSRLPSLFLHAFHASQIVIVDVTEPSKRAAALGRMSLSYGLGRVIGPLIGGQVASRFSEQSSAFVACGGSLLSVLIILKFIPKNTKTSGAKDASGETKSSEGIFNISKITSILTKSPGAIFFIFFMMIAGAPSYLFEGMLSVITMETFKLTPDQTGFILSFSGVISMLVQGFGIGILTKRYSEAVILNGSIITLLISYSFLCFVSTTTHLIVVLVLITCGNGVIGTVLTSSLTKTVSVTDTGTMLGLGHASQSLVSTMSPTAGAYLLERFGLTSFGIVGVVVYLMLLFAPKK